MTTADRVLSILRLFTLERPEWSVEAAARELGLSQSTAYQYFRSLVNAELIVAFKAGRYVIGPAIIELDRQTRHRDPLIQAAQQSLVELAGTAGDAGVALLCRLYGSTVMCVDQCAAARPSFGVSYERGRPMSLNRGAASKVILAYLPPRALKRHYEASATRAGDGGASGDWAAFKASLRDIRKAGYCQTQGELDPGVIGVSAPVFSPNGEILGSIGLVLAADRAGPMDRPIHHVIAAGHRLNLALKQFAETG
jgi:DNA-binding IclR family transcriptional regulator